ncbi:MAG: hypothetical protein DHS20C21_05210 [Gemmatimonadota bacterium]|nr:MAG: hypothetical protein DHS20C21_05210 [Gemmatimonadota bacterium]
MYELTPELVAEIEGLETLAVPQLREKYAELFDEPTRSKHKRHLVKRCTWGIQAREFGGLDPAVKERALQIARLSDIRLTPPATREPKRIAVDVTSDAPASTPLPGTVLVRRYRGQDLRVTILESGVEWSGTVYRSLSAAAKAITGSHCSGPAFFGLAKGKKA